LGSPGLAGAGPQQGLLGRSIDHYNIRPGTARHAPGPRSNLRPGGMGYWHQRCSTLCYLVSPPIYLFSSCGKHTTHHNIHHRLDGVLVRHNRPVGRNNPDPRPGSTNLCCLVDDGRSRHRNDPAVEGVPTCLRSERITCKRSAIVRKAQVVAFRKDEIVEIGGLPSSSARLSSDGTEQENRLTLCAHRKNDRNRCAVGVVLQDCCCCGVDRLGTTVGERETGIEAGEKGAVRPTTDANCTIVETNERTVVSFERRQ
jgi:hypothetical protein